LNAREPVQQVIADGEDTRLQAGATSAQPAAETGIMPAVANAEGADPAEGADAEEQSAPASDAAPQTRVLVVEDTVELAELVVIALRRVQIAAEYEARGERAFARYVELQPAVVLLDLNLPDMTGWKVLESIKDHVKQHGAPMPRIIVMTAMGDPANRLVGKLQGVFSYIVKPFTPADMQAAVQNALSAG
jgi:CheY-like chemotaxis protein